MIPIWQFQSRAATDPPAVGGGGSEEGTFGFDDADNSGLIALLEDI